MCVYTQNCFRQELCRLEMSWVQAERMGRYGGGQVPALMRDLRAGLRNLTVSEESNKLNRLRRCLDSTSVSHCCPLEPKRDRVLKGLWARLNDTLQWLGFYFLCHVG